MGSEPKKPGKKEHLRTLETIVAEHETALLRYATRILHNPHSAQDVVQRMFIKLFEEWKKRGYPEMAGIKRWLYRVTHNGAIDLIRHESRRRNLNERHAERQALEETRGPSTEDRKAIVLAHLDALNTLADKIMDQPAAAGVAQAITVAMPRQGKTVMFRRAIRVAADAPMFITLRSMSSRWASLPGPGLVLLLVYRMFLGPALMRAV